MIDRKLGLRRVRMLLLAGMLVTAVDVGSASAVLCGGDGCTMFATSTTYQGNMGGFAGADAACEARAAAAGLTGHYKAWLGNSDGGITTAASRLDPASGPFLRTCGGQIAANLAALQNAANVSLTNPVGCDEFGATVACTGMWTGTDADGSASNGCGGWTNTMLSGRTGNECMTGGNWTQVDLRSCTESRRIYCIEQDHDATCGNGTVESGEDCDDSGESADCDADCTTVSCGDGTVNSTAGEDCDDAGESIDCNIDCTTANCGDNIVNATAGEECDDGGIAPGDGCDADCQNEAPPAWTCDPSYYGDATCDCGCGVQDSDCPSLSSSVCDYDFCALDAVPAAANNAVCVADDGCPAEPSLFCREAAKSKLLILDGDDPTKDKLLWQWAKGEAYDHTDLGNPASTTSYRLCIYDTTTAVPSLNSEFAVPASDSLWKNHEPKGWTYADKTGSADGVIAVKLKPSEDDGKSSVKVLAKGGGLTLPGAAESGTRYFHQGPRVVAQLLTSDDECWTAEFGAAGTKKNTATQFKAASDGSPVPDPPCPTAVHWTMRADTDTEDRASEFDIGTSGFGHNLDPVDGYTIGFRLDCGSATEPNCGTCSVVGFDPTAGNCRCANAVTTACDEPGPSDADDCGGAACRCLTMPPTPMPTRGLFSYCAASQGGTTATGTWDPVLGSGSVTFDDELGMIVGSTYSPCPVCVGDPTANDGLRGGACDSGSRSGMACDANASDPQFFPIGGGDFSFDCPISGGNVVTAAGLDLSRTETTGSVDLADTLSCGGVEDACSGACTDTGGDEGECYGDFVQGCSLGQDEDGRIVSGCANDSMCSYYGLGVCSEVEQERCFLNPLHADGQVDASRPQTVSVGCLASTESPLVNSSLGLPGPIRTRSDWAVSYRH